jgi:hypothetical protein
MPLAMHNSHLNKFSADHFVLPINDLSHCVLVVLLESVALENAVVGCVALR